MSACTGVVNSESESETEAVTESESETETVAETEVQTESETEAKYGTDFSYEDETVVITAVAQPEAKLPENAVLKADPMLEGSAAYEDAVSMVENQLGGTEEGQEASYVFYDVYFEVNGERIEPADGLVEVSMNFKTPVLESAEDEQTEEVTVIHIDESTNIVQDVTDQIKLTDDGGVSAVGFTTDSFSPMGIRKIVKAATGQPEDRKNITATGNTVNYKIIVDDEEYTGKPIPRDASIDIQLTYAYSENNKPTKGDNGGYYWELPDLSGLELDPSWTSGTITYDEDKNGGTYEIKTDSDGKTRVYFTYDNSDGGFIDSYPLGISGTFNLWTKVKSTSSDNKITINLGDKEHTINLEPTDLKGTKSYVPQDDGTLLFTIVMEATDADATNVVITDKLTGTLSFVKGTFEAAKADGTKISNISVSYDENDPQKAYITIPEIKYGDKVTITYKVDPGADKTSTDPNTNTAFWGWGDGNGNGKGESGTVNVDLKGDTLKKTGEFDDKTNQIKYTIKINELGLKLLPDNSDGTHPNLIVQDTLDTTHVTLLFNTISVKDKDGNDIPGASYAYDEGVLTVEVPDEKFVILSYSVKANGKTKEEYKVTNNVSMSGDYQASVTTDVRIGQSAATVSGTKGTVAIRKISEYAVEGKIPFLNGAKFNLYKVDLDTKKESIVETGKVTKKVGSQDGKIVFGETSNPMQGSLLTNTLYYFRETEAPSGYVLNSKKYYFVIEATDATKSTISQKFPDITVNYCGNGATLPYVTNKTIPKPVDLTFNGDKKVIGSASVEDGFEFTAELKNYSKKIDGKEAGYVSDKLDKSKYSATGTNKGSKITFGSISLDYEGTYTFTIKEKAGTGSYLYDGTAYEVKVVVERDTTGNLAIKSKDIVKPSSTKKIVFTNTKTTGLSITKNVEAAVSEGTTFTFNLTWHKAEKDWAEFDTSKLAITGGEFEGTPNSWGATVKITVKAGEKAGTATITGLPVGVYVEKITEQTKSGWTMKSLTPGTLTLAENAESNQITVTNSYSASGTWTPKATKKLNAGGRKLKNNEFRFVVKDQAGNTVMTGTNNENNNVTFVTTDEKKTNSISYTAPGTYTYTIEEVTPADGEKETNMSYSDAVYTVTVTVTDPKKDGTLDVKAVYVSSKESGEKTSAEFVNTYTAKGSWKPAVSKILTGGASYGEGFTYTVKDKSTKKEVATGSNKDDGPISFTDITYDQTDIGKKYTYTIEETNKTRSDITYDDTVFTVSVEIEDKGNGVVGAKESSVVYKKARTTVTDPAFENKYKASGSAEIKGTKTLKNQILTAGAFTFGLFEDSAGTKPVKDASGKAITTTNKAARTADGKGEFVLNTPVYTQADIGKEYTYWVREISKGDQRYTYDTAAYQVSVKVSNKGNGELNVAVTYSSGAINFTNTYTATGSLDVTATKTVKGRTDVPNIFKFELIEITGSTSKVLQTVTNNGSQVTFDPIPYQVDKDKDKTYTYILKEETGSAAGYVGGYSTEEYRITAKITDDGTGNLKVAKTIEKKNADGTYSAHTANNGVPSFTNTYKATGKLTLSGKKILENHALEKDQFTFELYKIENYGKENQSYTQIDQKKNNADGSFTFDELTFNENQVGDNYYAVREVNEEAAHPGYSYLKDYVIVKVTVTDDGQGNLTATATPNGVTGDTALTITNTYTAKGRLQLKAHKSLTGAALREDNKFSFTLTGPKNTNQTKPNDLDGNVVFDTLEYDQSDIGQKYVYTLTETDEGKVGYTYDSKIYTVTVEVKDNHNGTLSTPYTIQMQEKAGSTATDYTKSSDEEVKIPEFSNSYEATGSAVLSGTKKLIGGTKELKAGDFSFKIYEVKMQKKSDDSDELVEVEEALKDAAGQEITVSNDAKGNFTFPEISYTQNDVGVHTYRIKEINDGKPGYTYDSASVEVTINVKDNHNKTLDTTERTYKKGGTTVGAINFENSYAANGSFTPQAIKALEGHKLSADQFTFVLYEVKDKEEKEIESKTNDAAGIVSFKTIDYSQADIGKTFVYRIKEVNKGADGYTYSKEEYTITVSVTDNNGSLTVTPVYTNKEGKKIENAEEVVFKNTYAATGDATISGTKTLTGNRTLDNEQFSFKLTTDPEGKNLVKDSKGKNMIVKNDADGNFTFPVLQYDQDDVKDAEDIKAGKDFTYYVSEIANPDDEVYTYSTRIYKVVINVKDDGGKLTVAEPVITDLSTGKPAGIAFENHYNAKGSLNLTATKKLDVVSDKVKLSANLFSFTLIGDNIEKQTKWNNADGSVIFDPIEYTEKDIDKDFTYTMTEQYGKLSGFEYSNEVYTIKVHVSDNRDGSLNAEAKVTNSEGEDVKLGEIQFVNKYEATGILTLEGTKVLNGRKLEAGKFTFALSEDGEVLQRVANAEDGSIQFAPINYTTADIGSHTYTVQEVTPAADGNDYTYDRTIYTVVVEVSDNGNVQTK